MLHKLHSLNKLHSVGLGGNKNKTVTTEVVDIELIDKLDDGSKNDGNAKGFKATFQKGVKYGKTYRFKVKSYSNGVPKKQNRYKVDD